VVSHKHLNMWHGLHTVLNQVELPGKYYPKNKGFFHLIVL
jgi:hypothetical protein